MKNILKVILRGGTFSLLLFFCKVEISLAQEIRNQNEVGSNFGEIYLAGLDKTTVEFLVSKNLSSVEWSSFFRVSIDGSERPILGKYEVQEEELVFKPRFLPDPNVSYVAVFSPKELQGIVRRPVSLKDLNKKIRFKPYNLGRTKIQAIYPLAEILPSNVLRIYLEFTQPMGLENPYHFLSIEDLNGKSVEEPFVEVETGLWNPDRTRLTLLLHPGRIKRGVGPNVTKGEIFEMSNTYYLKISKEWMDAQGIPLGSDVEKRIEINEPLRSKLSMEEWEVKIPTLGTSEPAKIHVDRLLDYFLVKRLISFHDEDANIIIGEVVFDASKMEIIFVPETIWQNKNYYIMVNNRLEDVSGNTPLNAFDYEKKEHNSEDEKGQKIHFRPK